MKVRGWKGLAYKASLMAMEMGKGSVSEEHRKAREDPLIFCEKILGKKAASHHVEWKEAIVTECDTSILKRIGGSNLRISAPRGSGKSTFLVPLLAWTIGHNPHIRIILTSYADDVALSFSVAVKKVIESDFYSFVFPEIRPSRRWRDKAWTIDRDAAGVTEFIKDSTFYAVGMQGAIASRRADLIVIDDPIKSGKQIKNKSVREDMVFWWGEVLSPTLVPSGRVLNLCTRYRKDDIHGTHFTEAKGWQVIVQKAIILQDGVEKSFWEDYMKLDFLLTKRVDDPVSFASQYQNDPVSISEAAISPESIRYFDLRPSLFSEISIGVDLGSGGVTSDFNAAVVIGKTLASKSVPSKYFVLQAWRSRCSISQLMSFLGELYGIYSPLASRINYQIESVAYQAAFYREFKRYSQSRGYMCRVDSVKPVGTKSQRLYGVSGLFDDGLLSFSQEKDMGCDRLISELLDFGYGSYDDLCDAFMYALSRLYRSEQPLRSTSYRGEDDNKIDAFSLLDDPLKLY